MRKIRIVRCKLKIKRKNRIVRCKQNYRKEIRIVRTQKNSIMRKKIWIARYRLRIMIKSELWDVNAFITAQIIVQKHISSVEYSDGLTAVRPQNRETIASVSPNMQIEWLTIVMHNEHVKRACRNTIVYKYRTNRTYEGLLH